MSEQISFKTKNTVGSRQFESRKLIIYTRQNQDYIVFESIFKQKRNEKDVLNETIRQMDINYVKMIYEMERMGNLNRKIDKIGTKMKAFEEVASTNGIDIKPQTMSVKTKDVIKLILEKHGELTSSELSKIIKLSRTRCNEYLKEMENEQILASKVNCRKKLYFLRQ